MTRLIASTIRPLALSVAFTAGVLALSAPAAAQEEGGDKVNTLIIYGKDECPQSTPGEITVCARLDESERYRVPEILRQSEAPENQSWGARVRSFETVGKFGPLSCTPVGAGGDLGCTAQMIAATYEGKAQAPGVRFSDLIQEQRAKRLAQIDEEAAATQARVETIERDYAARQEAKENAAAGQNGTSFEQAPVGAEVPITPPVTTTDVGVPAPLVDPSPETPGSLPAPDTDNDTDNTPRPVGPQVPVVIKP